MLQVFFQGDHRIQHLVENLGEMLPLLFRVFEFVAQQVVVDLLMDFIQRGMGIADGAKLGNMAEQLSPPAVKPLAEFAFGGIYRRPLGTHPCPGNHVKVRVFPPAKHGGLGIAQLLQGSSFIHLALSKGKSRCEILHRDVRKATTHKE